MLITKSAFLNVLAVLTVISFIFLRPGMVGQIYTVFGLTLLLLVVCLNIFIKRSNMNNKPDYWFFFSLFIFWCFLFLFGVIGDANVEFLFKAVVANFIIVSIFCFISLGNILLTFRVVDGYLFLLTCFGYSSFVSLLLFFSGFGVDQLFIMELDLGYDNPSKLLFPFSILYHDMHSGYFNMLRFQSVFRESGIAQAFFTWALIIAYYLGNHKLILLGLFLGLLSTFSTTGVAISLLIIPLALIAKKGISGTVIKRVFIIFGYTVGSIFFLFFAYFITLNIPYFGVLSKLETHGESITERLPRFENISLLGQGFYSNITENSAINLLKATESIGVLLVVFYIFMFTFMCWLGRSKHSGFKVFVALSPLFITSLIAQPIVDAPLVFILLFITRQILSTNEINSYHIYR